jgi:hypothetical protein
LDLHGESLSWIAVGKSPGTPGDVAHGDPTTRSIRPCRGRIDVPSHTPHRIDDPFQGRAVRWRRHPGGGVHFRRTCPRLLQSRPSACELRPPHVGYSGANPLAYMSTIPEIGEALVDEPRVCGTYLPETLTLAP